MLNNYLPYTKHYCFKTWLIYKWPSLLTNTVHVCALYTRVECSSVNKSRGRRCELLYYKAASARGRRVVISHNFSFRTPVQSRQQRNNKRKAVKATVTAGSAVNMRKHGYQPYRKSRAYLIVLYLTCFNCLNPPPLRKSGFMLFARLSLSFTRLFNKTGNQESIYEVFSALYKSQT